MATTSEARALPFFTDLYGQPLESGSIYIGQPGRDPMAYPVTVTSDTAGLVVLQQPVRTTHGHAVSGGAQVHMFCPIPYSITVLDSSRRVVYASLQETDLSVTSLGTSTVQSAADLPTLRARSGQSSNQVWVAGFGMYVYVPSDTTSPESVPFVIVGSDGSRYYLNLFDANLNFAKISGGGINQNAQGLWITWNDASDGVTQFTNNKGAGAGGFVLRIVNTDNTVESGRTSIDSAGNVITTGNIQAAGVLLSSEGTVELSNDGSRQLRYDGTNYQLPGAQLFVAGELAITEGNLNAELVNIFQHQGVGGINITTGASPTPGTWFAITSGVGTAGISLWVRTA